MKIQLENVDPFEHNKIDQDCLNAVNSCLKKHSNEEPIAIRESFVQDSDFAEIVELLSGIEAPALTVATGYVIQQLQPIIIQYVKNQSAKETTVESNGNQITLKGGASEAEVKRALSILEQINSGKDES